MQKKQCLAINKKWMDAGLMDEQLFDTQISFTETPGGKLSIEQILNGERTAIWETSNPGKSFVKKKIIITDWLYAKGLSSSEEDFSVYHTLLDEGFSLYVWSNNQLISIKNRTELGRALKTVTLVDQSLLQNEMKKLDFSHDASYFADLVGSQHLIKTLVNPKFQKKFLWNELQKLPKDYLDALVNNLPLLTTTQFILDKINLESSHLPETGFKNIFHIGFTRDFKKTLTWNDVQEIFLMYPNLKSIDLTNCGKLDNFPQNFMVPASLETLDCSESSTTWISLNNIIKNSPNLKTLILGNYFNVLSAPPADLIFPASLESLSCYYTNITWTSLQNSIQNCRYLKSLILENCENLGEPPLDLLLPASLEVLRCEQTDLTWNQLRSILQGSPSLKLLSLYGCKGELSEDYTFPSSLEEFRCQFTKTSWMDMQRMLQGCSNLKSLNPNNCKNLGEPSQDFPLPASLETLDCSGTDITWKHIQDIIKGCPKLKSLNLYSCLNLGDLPEDFTFPATLETLNCQYTSISWAQIQCAIKSTPNLNSINLSECANLGKFSENIRFPASLKTFNCNNTNTTWLDVMSIGNYCPNLEYLDISSCRHLGKLPQKGTLPPSLKKLSCADTNSTAMDLEKIIKDCPNLKSINLSSCTNLGKPLGEISFPISLDELFCNRSTITWEDVQNIIQRCPNLTTLNLNFCNNLGVPPENFTVPMGLTIRSNTKTSPKTSSTAEREPDNRTENSNTPLNVRTLFKPKKNGTLTGRDYRLGIYTQINEQSKQLRQISKEFLDNEKTTYSSANTIEDLYDNTMEESPDCFLGRITVEQGTHNWMALPSLSPNDVIDPAQIQLDPPAEFSLAFCTEEGMHYIKPKNPLHTNTTLTFIVTAKDSSISIPTMTLSKEQRNSLSTLQFNKNGKLSLDSEALKWLTKENSCQALIAYCSKFKAKKLSNNQVHGDNLLNQLIRERAGHCRHRAHVFMALAKELGIDCRYVDNDCHAYVEVLQENQWVRVDLGGSPANLKTMPFIKEPRKMIKSFSEESPELKIIDHNNPYKTWDMFPSKSTSLTDYTEELLNTGIMLPEEKRNLLCTLEREQIDGLHQTLLEQAKKNTKTVFFIDNLNHVPLQQIVVNNDSGHYSKKDSALIEFLKTAREGDVLLVNWSDYEAQHVGLNTLIDKERKLKGILINKGVTVISLLSHDKKAEMGEDFYSRCRVVSSMPSHLTVDSISIPQGSVHTMEGATEICFYDDDWRTVLTGAIQLTPKGYELTESLFVTALKEKKSPLILRNAPWHLPAFRSFMRTMESSGEIWANGSQYSLNEAKLYRDDSPYDLKNAPVITSESIPSDEALLILNNTTYHSFFQQYSIDERHLKAQPGFLEQHKNKTLHILLTSPLTNNQWEKFFTQAKKNQVLVHLSTAPGIEIPKNFDEKKAIITTKPTQSFQLTNDLGYSIKEYSKDLIIPISEKTTLAELIEIISSTGEQETLNFHSQPGALSKALLEGKNVILAGTPSRSLTEGLASLFLPQPYILLNGRCESVKGNLTLVSEMVEGLDFVGANTQIISNDMRWEALGKRHDLYEIGKLKRICDEFIMASNHPSFSYTQLDSMLTRMIWKPHANPLKPLLRLSPEYEQLKPLVEKAWESFKKERTHKTRLEKVTAELEQSPYVFLAGPSGVGKSHFIHNELALSYEILEGLDKLEQFVIPNGKKKCLFIDEANLLHPNAMEIFNGLFHKPPQLLIKGQLIPLPEGHKIVFAGNFGHFKGRREMPFFAQHGHIITFKALSDDELRNKIVTPILNILFPVIAKTEGFKNMENVFLKIYKKYGDRLSLTARNLEMMALRSKAFSNKDGYDITQIASLCAYDEIRLLLNKQERQVFCDWCETKFKLEKGFLKKNQQLLKEEISLESPSFFLTQSRKNPIRLLDALMSIREDKIRDSNLGKKGINALLIEGEAGIGKSLLAMAYLESKGFKNGKTNEIGSLKYYHLTPSAGLDVIKETLHKAFHEGAVIIIDELNTLPLEDLLNPMLSGVDENGHSAAKEGFTLIATQNPITYAKRQSLSTALLNRCQKIDLKNYPLKELTEIMFKISANDELAHTMVSQFDQALKFANEKNLHPKPTPRNLFSDGERAKNAKRVHQTQKTPITDNGGSIEIEEKTVGGSIKPR